MSISPPEGQLGPTVQYAGQVPQPNGMALKSAMNKPLLYAFFDVRRTLMGNGSAV